MQVKITTKVMSTNSEDRIKPGVGGFHGGYGYSYVEFEEFADVPVDYFGMVEYDQLNLIRKNNKMTEQINHPSHYGGANNPYEAIKVIEAWGLGFNTGNVIKYLSRAGKKNPGQEIQDLEKAKWYLEREISNLKSRVENHTGGLFEQNA